MVEKVVDLNPILVIQWFVQRLLMQSANNANSQNVFKKKSNIESQIKGDSILDSPLPQIGVQFINLNHYGTLKVK
jgi:hypothetical protein